MSSAQPQESPGFSRGEEVKDAIRTAALAAVAEIGSEWEGQARVIQATKLVRDRTGCNLHTAIDAVKWAIDRPAAATLPVGSIVGSAGCAFFKWGDADEEYPWSATHVTGPVGDTHIDDLVRSDRATILRVGDGAS